MRGENMSSHHISVRSLVSRKLVGAFFAVFALLAQPLLPINVPSAFAIAGSVHTTDLSTWDLSETRSAGHQALLENGLHVWTDTGITGSPDPRKAAAYYSTNFSLADAADFNLDWTGTTPAAGGQLAVDLDNNGSTD